MSFTITDYKSLPTGTIQTIEPQGSLTDPGDLAINNNAKRSTDQILALTPNTLGDIVYGGAAGAATILPGNTSATKKFLTQTGTGSVSASLAWGVVASGDVSGLGTAATTNASAYDVAGAAASAAAASDPLGTATTATAHVPKIIFDHYADVSSVGTAETTIYTDTIAAGQLTNNGDKLTAIYGLNLVNSASTKEIRLYFGGTVIFDSGALAVSASGDASFNVLIIRDGATSVRFAVSAATTTGATVAGLSNVGKVTGLTLSATNILKITGQAAGIAAANADLVGICGTVRYEPAA